jgi:transglutaminase-like putative cysteine protease
MIEKKTQKEKRWWDLVSVLLLFVNFTIAYNRLFVTHWTEHLEIVRTIAYLGLFSGLALGYSRFSHRLAFVIGLVYGIYLIPWRIGLFLGSEIPWNERLYGLWVRLQIIFDHIFQRKPVPDNLLFILLMCILFWILSTYAGYTLTRFAEPWKIIIPTGVVLVMLHSYDSFYKIRIWYLVAYLLVGLSIVARLNFYRKRYTWEQTQTHLPAHISADIMRITAEGVFMLLLFAWVIPVRAASIQSAADAWNVIKQPFHGIRDSFDNAFASLKSSVGIVSDYYGSTLLLGHGNRLSDSEVFTVLTPLHPPIGIRYYWRARVFDHYEDGEWTSTFDSSVSIDPTKPTLDYPKYEQRAPGLYSFFFTTDRAITTLYTVPQPEWVSINAKSELIKYPDGTSDISAFQAMPALHSGDAYYVRSSLSDTTIKTLRDSDSAYPTWIRERYLQLPESITLRTIEFAAYLTDRFNNPYDKVMAVTNYLRNNVEYQESVPQLPNDKEPMDWFLFDYRKGFCNYYATAEIVLLRSIGIPARLAVGFAQGEYQEDRKAYIVRERDAHAWPEVYFSNVGWVEFEPTSAQPVLVRPTGEIGNIDTNIAPSSSINDANIDELNKFRGPRAIGDIPRNTFQRHRNLIYTLGFTSVLVIVSTALFIRRRQFGIDLPTLPVIIEKGVRRLGFKPPSIIEKWSRQSSITLIERAYQEVNRSLARLGTYPSPAITPRERIESLSKIIPEASHPGERLVKEYELARYSLQPANTDDARRAAFEIRVLSFRKVFQTLFTGSKKY